MVRAACLILSLALGGCAWFWPSRFGDEAQRQTPGAQAQAEPPAQAPPNTRTLQPLLRPVQVRVEFLPHPVAGSMALMQPAVRIVPVPPERPPVGAVQAEPPSLHVASVCALCPENVVESAVLATVSPGGARPAARVASARGKTVATIERETAVVVDEPLRLRIDTDMRGAARVDAQLSLRLAWRLGANS